VAISPSNGNIAYISTSDYSSGNNYNGDSFVRVWKTTNGGTSWTQTLIDTSREVPPCAWAAGCTQGFFGTTPNMAIDSAGKLLIAYHVNSTPDVPEQMYIRTSLDGVTWTPRLQISVPSTTVNNAFPAVAAHPTTANDFRVAWQDDRTAEPDRLEHLVPPDDQRRHLLRRRHPRVRPHERRAVQERPTATPSRTATTSIFRVGPDGVNQLIWGEALLHRSRRLLVRRGQP